MNQNELLQRTDELLISAASKLHDPLVNAAVTLAAEFAQYVRSNPPGGGVAWMPIESLPEGELAWLFTPNKNGLGGRQSVGYFIQRDDGKVWVFNGSSAHENLCRSQKWPMPTHWTPLPPPPNGKTP